MDTGKFWEIMATVIPVIALAFVVEVRHLRFDMMSPMRRLTTALVHAATVIVLLFSEIAALNSLAGIRQADWAVVVALNGCAAALAVVLADPAIKFLIIAIHGTSLSDYRRYWEVSRLLKTGKRQIRRMRRLLRRHSRTEDRVRKNIDVLVSRSSSIRVQDLHSAWAKESHLARLEGAREHQRHLEDARTKAEQALDDALKNHRKTERKIMKLAGRRTKLILRTYEKNEF